jgi:bifunctional oligoribonuclease and PAP phosphatase NrnA
MTSRSPELGRIVDAVRQRQRFVLSSHSRPDGDSIGSQLAMAFALRALGKHVYVVNIDHHPGNTAYGQLNWFDSSAAACAEMVLELIDALGVPLQADIATHIYLAILTDTGSFHYSSISPRTFDICRRTLEAGVDPVLVARNVYDSNNMGRLKLFGSVLSAMQLDPTGRIAIVYLDHEMAREAGGTYEDTEGLINLPLTVKEIEAVVFFKQTDGDEYRVSMRSKGEIDIGAIAKQFGGGGHKNAAGCTVTGPIDALQKTFIERIDQAIQTTTSA